MAFVTTKSNAKYESHVVTKECITLIREHIGPVASFKICFVVPRLPKTRSGKYLRHIIRKMYNKHKYEIPSTVEDVEVVY